MADTTGSEQLVGGAARAARKARLAARAAGTLPEESAGAATSLRQEFVKDASNEAKKRQRQSSSSSSYASGTMSMALSQFFFDQEVLVQIIISFFPAECISPARELSQRWRKQVEAKYATPRGLFCIIGTLNAVAHINHFIPCKIHDITDRPCDKKLMSLFPTWGIGQECIPFSRLTGNLLLALFECGEVGGNRAKGHGKHSGGNVVGITYNGRDGVGTGDHLRVPDDVDSFLEQCRRNETHRASGIVAFGSDRASLLSSWRWIMRIMTQKYNFVSFFSERVADMFEYQVSALLWEPKPELEEEIW